MGVQQKAELCRWAALAISPAPALDQMPRTPEEEKYAAKLRAKLSKKASQGFGSISTAAQQRYCKYFEEVLNAPQAPMSKRGHVTITKIILSSAPAVGDMRGCRPYVKVFRRGHEIGTNLAPGEYPQFIQESQLNIPFDLGIPIMNDVALTIHHWTGDAYKDGNCPLFVYAFHAGFKDAGLQRIYRIEMDTAYPGKLDVPSEFFIDMITEPSRGRGLFRRGNKQGALEERESMRNDTPWTELIMVSDPNDPLEQKRASSRSHKLKKVLRHVNLVMPTQPSVASSHNPDDSRSLLI
ncbi:hypothetical protein CBR_g22927 [Chara braunii]|uniref:C2 tensin-type domain-containing protein n=1 Tax=Chara braunii TaxID=69332 RepID=A0A388L376_CHABU|nr:hypothetical protein CBR_g22927 [Chara braunii]|eukprot:GBG76708.1 hypothetical protein CBR_g22927 [Chara braunii]